MQLRGGPCMFVAILGYEVRHDVINKIILFFIVVAEEVYSQLIFYIENLRPDMNTNRVFTTKASPVNQTHVANSLTASLFKAGVIKEKTNRVCCTRIRCGIATFACNEADYDSAFFAKHFMMNRESTTLGHYNLLSNRRHAISIAMNLYSSFSGVEVRDRNKMTDDLKMTTDKNKILDWIKTSDIELTKTELSDLEKLLEPLTKRNFYAEKVFLVNLSLKSFDMYV